jgi:hypothetical protein
LISAAKRADLPIEQTTKFELPINLNARTAAIKAHDATGRGAIDRALPSRERCLPVL